MRQIYLHLFLIILTTSVCFATTINVPADQPTIQAGIDAAADGDLVLVAEGTYYENIIFKGKAITVASRFLTDGKEVHIKRTIINGSRPSHPDSGSVVYFIDGENEKSVLCGFTITGGSGTIYYPATNARIGGGICALFSGATIKNNIIENNIVHYHDNTMGGGIFVWQLNSQGLNIEGNIIRNNQLISDDNSLYSLGAGMYTNVIGSDVIRIVNNLIKDNTVSALFAWGGGIEPSNWGNGMYNIMNNIITGNSVEASIFGGAGGIDMFNHIPVTRNNVISENFAPSGGGINIEFLTAAEEEATAALTKKAAGGLRGSLVKSLNKTTTGSTADVAVLSNNTIVDNSSSLFGGGVSISGIKPQFMNFIIRGNSAPDGLQISGTADVHHSNVEGGWAGTGNIDADPVFSNDMCFLGINSPCTDAGNPNPAYNDPESKLFPGHARFPARGTVRNDMGAYGGPGAANWWNSVLLDKGAGMLLQGKHALQNPSGKKVLNLTGFPNPFNSQMTISFELAENASVSLDIYNALGQKVATLVNRHLNKGDYRYIWNADNLSSGVYFYILRVNDTIYRNKLILIK